METSELRMGLRNVPYYRLLIGNIRRNTRALLLYFRGNGPLRQWSAVRGKVMDERNSKNATSFTCSPTSPGHPETKIQ